MLRRTVVVLLAAFMGSILPVVIATPQASAATSARPHRGAWHYVALAGNHSTRSAHLTVSKSGVWASKISVRPRAAAGCASTAVATVPGKFRIRAASGAYKYKVGGTQSAQAPVIVKVHQHGKTRQAYLYIGFSSHTRARGELEIGASGSCVVSFGLRS